MFHCRAQTIVKIALALALALVALFFGTLFLAT